MGNEYWPKGCKVLRLGSKGRYHMAHSTGRLLCGCQVKLWDPKFTSAIPERLRGEQLIIKHYRDEAYFVLNTHRNTSGRKVNTSTRRN